MGRRSSKITPIQAVAAPPATTGEEAPRPVRSGEAWTVADGVDGHGHPRTRLSHESIVHVGSQSSEVRSDRDDRLRRVVTLSAPGGRETGSDGTTPERREREPSFLPGQVPSLPLTGSLWGREPEPAGEFVLLEDLQFSIGLLWPPFAPERLLYTLYVRSNDGPMVVIFPVAPAASCTINGRAGPAGPRSVEITSPVQRIAVHVSSIDSPPTPYLITVVQVHPDTYGALQAGHVPKCIPMHPPPLAVPTLAAFGGGQHCRVIMEFDGSAHGTKNISPGGSMLLVSSALRDDACGWWAARETQGVEAMTPFWAPAMCLRPLDHEPPPPRASERTLSTTPEAGPEQLWDALSRLRQAVSPTDRAAGEAMLVRSLATLDKKELSFAEAALKPGTDELGSSRRHQAVNFPYFSCVLAACLVLALVGTLARFGGASVEENPLLGAPWAGIRRSGACWPPDLHSGHVYQPFTALIIPAGAIALAYDLALLKLVVARQERVYGLRRIAATFVGCGAGGHLTAAVFTPRWISTGPEPGLAAVMMVLLLELTLRGRWTRGRLLDATLLVAAFVVLAVIGGFPGVNLWALLGGSFLGIPAALLYSRRLVYDETSVRLARVCGAVLAGLVSVALIVGFWVGVDPDHPWCDACTSACFAAHGWCDEPDTS